MKLTYRRALLLALVSALCAACGQQQELSACDITTERCQEDVFYAVLRLRGDGFDAFDGVPPIRNVTLAEYRAQLARDAERAGDKSGGDDKAKNPWDLALSLLGLIAPSTSTKTAAVNDAVLNVAAYYSPSLRQVTVIDRGGTRSDRGATTLLAHELVHAFQDNEFGDFPPLSTDGTFAVRALVEGEATLYEHLVGAEIDGETAEDLDWKSYYQGWVLGLRDSLPQQDSTYFAVNWFIYPLGAGMLTRAWLDGGNAAVRHALGDYPTRTLDLVAAHEGTSDASSLLRCAVQSPGGRFERVAFDRFGALQLYAFLAAAEVPEADAWEAATRWRDDLLFVYFDAQDETAIVHWRLRMSSKATAETLDEAIPDTQERVLEVVGKDLLVRASNDPELLQSWAGVANCE